MRLQSAETLSALMKQRGFSMGQMADHAKCSKGFISHLIAGRRTTCTTELAERIAEVLNVPSDVLFVPSTTNDSVRNRNQRGTTSPAPTTSGRRRAA